MPVSTAGSLAVMASAITFPYCDTIPTRAKVQNWPTSEVNGEIYMWFHPTGAEPDSEVPVIEQIGDENWTEPRQVEFNIPVHIQDIAENSCDPGALSVRSQTESDATVLGRS